MEGQLLDGLLGVVLLLLVLLLVLIWTMGKGLMAFMKQQLAREARNAFGHLGSDCIIESELRHDGSIWLITLRSSWVDWVYNLIPDTEGIDVFVPTRSGDVAIRLSKACHRVEDEVARVRGNGIDQAGFGVRARTLVIVLATKSLVPLASDELCEQGLRFQLVGRTYETYRIRGRTN